MALNQQQQSVFDLMAATLKSWGLTALLPDLQKLIVNGDTNGDTLALALSQTDAYKRRFKANEARKAAGLRELTPAEYLATEEQYYNIMRAYNLPSGFYDSQDDFTKFIANDKSPSEVESMVKVAHDQFMAAPDEYKAKWREYGFTTGDALAGILDPKVATSLLQDRAQQVALGGEAARQGFAVNQSRAQQFQQAGVSIDQARKAYAELARIHEQDRLIAQRFGTDFTQQQEENDLLLNDPAAALKRQSLYSQEEALFKSRSGADTSAISINTSY